MKKWVIKTLYFNLERHRKERVMGIEPSPCFYAENFARSFRLWDVNLLTSTSGETAISGLKSGLVLPPTSVAVAEGFSALAESAFEVRHCICRSRRKPSQGVLIHD